MKQYILLGALTLLPLSLVAQDDLRPVLTATPALQIAPDARAAGMGDLGVATSPDINAQYWNPAKYAFSSERNGVAISYTPWLSKIVDNVALLQASGFIKLDNSGTDALAASIRYFSVGEVTRWDANGYATDAVKPSDWAFDLSYSFKLRQELSVALALRYINSDQGLHRGQALVGDLSAYLQKDFKLSGRDYLWTLGANIKNLGSKISYDKGATSSFLPTSLSVGTGLATTFGSQHRLALHLELSKLLVPMSPRRADYLTDAEYQKARNDYQNTGWFSGLSKSFNDARGGFAEELREVRWVVGAEYSYDNKLFLRSGYSYQHPSKGNLQALSLGAGVKHKGFTVDASYLISTSPNNPLDQTLRITLGITPSAIRW